LLRTLDTTTFKSRHLILLSLWRSWIYCALCTPYQCALSYRRGTWPLVIKLSNTLGFPIQLFFKSCFLLELR